MILYKGISVGKSDLSAFRRWNVTQKGNLSWLLCRRVIHTVGPRYAVRYHTAAENALSHCYRSCLELLIEQELSRSDSRSSFVRIRWRSNLWLLLSHVILVRVPLFDDLHVPACSVLYLELGKISRYLVGAITSL